MSAFEIIRSRVVPIAADDIDTDQIIPARYLKVTSKQGLGDALFVDWRGAGKPAAILASPEATGAAILLAGRNFGCGSSREHAPWALTGFGFRAVVASSFADIFRNNALKNSLLPVEVPEPVLAELHAARGKDPSLELTVDLERTRLTGAGVDVPFPIDPFARRCLLEGVDELGYLLSRLPQIEAHEQRRKDG